MAARKRRLLAAMAERRLDGMLLFAQESDYWLTGYDSFGFCFFQCLYVGADGRVALLTRAPDLRQAQHTSDIADIRVWKDGEGADPTLDLKAVFYERNWTATAASRRASAAPIPSAFTMPSLWTRPIWTWRSNRVSRALTKPPAP